MNKVSSLALGIALTLGLAACSHSDKSATSQAPTIPAVSGIETKNFDPAVRHQDDFYYSVNGLWLANTPIPADQSNYGAFSVLYDESQQALRLIIEQAAANKGAKAGTNQQKIGDFYNSYMNTQLLDELGASPIQPLLSDIAKAKTHDELAAVMGKLLINGASIPMGFYVNNDAKNSSEYAVYLGQSGLTLPDRDYYLKNEPKFVASREALAKYVTEVMTEAGYSAPERAAQSVAVIENFIAEHQWSRTESRDANKRYNKMSMEKLQTLLGSFDVSAFNQAVGLEGKTADIIVSQPSYFEALGKKFKTLPLRMWQDYLAFHLVDNYAELLSGQFVDLHFGFHGQTLQGIEAQKPRWKKAVDAADGVIGEMIGEEYVKANFKPEAKARMEVMIQNLIKAFEVSINELEWMSAATKLEAQDKLSKFTYKIGYPDKWRDYSELSLAADDLVGNYERYSQFEYAQMIAKLGKPIDRTEWHMTPQTVNAYFNPVMNEIVFPAAILQPPFFNMAADDAVNYGGIGAVIGHEISHGFDDQGSKYDGNGNLRNWWTEQDKQEFTARAKQLAEQYSQYEALPGKFVNGEMTLGENIGDLGGLTVAMRAYQMSLNGKPSPVLDGLSGEQRLFVGWSQVWRRNYRDEEMGRRLLTDVHSPSHYRAMGTPKNIAEFYQAFDVKEGDKMYLAPEQRVKIW
ncbi:M13 family peptidase [Shewanella sp. SNU WT4]|uniref:M13 family metallopeptidase n=1 Tax=Shewanella sp. SNU WT4 TaxID=2590015 RepID=UPI00112974AE|nr:M13-type metalloendopeptidase [Shewanella sp. SNU WT4]QDF65893.1 M13 family peptidase [Shewanella sp. SNU WT4]